MSDRLIANPEHERMQKRIAELLDQAHAVFNGRLTVTLYARDPNKLPGRGDFVLTREQSLEPVVAGLTYLGQLVRPN